MRRLFKLLMACLCVSSILFACSDGNSVGNEDENGENTSTLKPEEHKAKLDEIGVKMLQKVNPADHKDLLKAIDTFCELADRGGLFSGDDEEVMYSIKTLKNIRRVCAKSDLGGMLAFSDQESDDFTISDFYGIFTYKNGEWKQAESDSKLEFRFPVDSKDAVFTMTSTGNGSNLNDEKANISEKVTATMTWGGNELCKMVANASTDNSARSANINTNLSASGYSFDANVAITKEKATCDFTMKSKDEVLISATAYVNGKGLTNDYNDNEAIEDRLGNAYSKVSIMKDIDIVVTCSGIKDMVAKLEVLDASYDNLKEDEEERYEKESAKIINNYMKGEFRYSGSDYLVATLGVQAYREEYSWTDWEGKEHFMNSWDLETIITFASDETSYSLESYFDDEVSFKGLINSFENLAKQYESYLKYLK